MGSLPPVFVEFIGSASKFKAVAGEVSAELDKLDAQGAGAGAKMGAIGSGLLAGAAVAAAATAAVGVEALKQASDFQFQITRLQTAAGEVPANLKLVSDGILNIAKDTGTTLAQLTSGAYVIESAGFHGADALNILKAAAQGAKIENADLGEVTNAVTSLMVDYHLKASDAALVTSQLVTAVGHGKTTFQDLAGALPNVAAAAQSANVTLGETASAIAEMTMHGTDASKAGTYLRQVIGQLEAPTAKARAAMRSLGIDANQLGLTLSSGSGHGLSDAITEIENGIQNHLTPAGLVAMDVFKKSQGSVSDYQKLLANIPPTLVTTFGALTEMTGGVKSMQGFLQLGGQNLAQFNETTKAVNAAVPDAAGNVKDWAITSRTLSVEFDRAKEYLQVFLVEIGNKMIPLIQDAIDWTVAHKKQFQELGAGIEAFAKKVADAFAPAVRILVTVIKDAASWVEQHRKGLTQLAQVIGFLVITAIKTFVQSLRLAWDAVHAVLIVIGNLWDFFKGLPGNLETAGKAIENFFVGLPSKVQGLLADAVNWLLQAGKDAITGLLNGIVDGAEGLYSWLNGLSGQILNRLAQAGTWLVNTGRDIVNGLTNGLVAGWKSAWDWLNQLGNSVLSAVGNIGNYLYNIGKAIMNGLWDGLKTIWNDMKDWLSSVGGWIQHLKGPIDKDRQLLVPHGKAIMAGLNEGLMTGFGSVQDNLAKMAPLIGSAISAPQLQFGGAIGGLTAGLVGQSSVVNVNLTVQGHVTTENDLVDMIEQRFLQLGGRRGQTYQSYKR